MSHDLPIRGGRVRRRSSPRRASRALSPRRAGAALTMLGSAALVWGAVASPAFGVKDVEIDGARLTGEAAVRNALGLSVPQPNAFTLATDEMRTRVAALPAIADADVSIGLPGTLRVTVTEREPVLAWRHGDNLYLVDPDGRVIADASAPGTGAAAAAARSLPVVLDRRTGGSVAVGGVVRDLDLVLATSLLSLVPADVGSSAPALSVAVDDTDGWSIAPRVDDPWVAVFGFYGPEVRKPSMIPEQVRLLRSLLVGREAQIARVVLAGEREGTFTERSSP